MVIAILLQFQQVNKAEFLLVKPTLVTPQQNCAHVCVCVCQVIFPHFLPKNPLQIIVFKDVYGTIWTYLICKTT